jgi:TolB-like protein/class 3 adenylate cyclase/Flp pilus assembly protein TadD
MAEARVERRLAAILAADVAGYSRLMGADEEGTLARLKALRRDLIDPKIEEHTGRIIKTTGDGMLVEFASVVNAVRCAVEVQRGMFERNTDVPHEKRIEYRIGINVGDIIIDSGDIFGDGVNVAARLEGISEPGGICVSSQVQENAQGKVDITFEDAGEQQLKNIARPVRAYRLRLDRTAAVAATPPALPNKPSIAVLPFTNMSGDPEQEYFVDGMVEDLITALSRIRWLFVIARNSSFTYKSRAVNVADVGRELGVRYVLEGSVRKGGNHVRITTQLIDASTGNHIWAERYDRDLADIFRVQDEVVRQVVAAIEPNLEAREILRARAKPTEKLDAYELYLRARPLMIPFTQDALRNAARLLQEAINIDPDYSDAWAAMAICRLHLTFGGWDNDVNRGYTDALIAAQQSITADPGNGHSLAHAARVLAVAGGNIDEAVDLANRALHLHPNSAEVQTQCGWVFVVDGNSEKALECCAAARQLNPVDPYWFHTFNVTAAAYIVARRFEDAIHWSGRVLASRPDDPVALRFHAVALTYLGRSAEASSAIAHMLTVQPNYQVSRTRWSFRTDAARELFTEAMIRAGTPP